MKVSQTRRRFLRVAGLGCVGGTGCTHFDSERAETRTDPPSTLVPTWRGHDPTSTVTLQWLARADGRTEPTTVGAVAGDGRSVATARTDVVPFGESDLFRHRAVLTDLEEGARYGVSVESADTGLAVRTAPAELTEPLTFAEGGDIGTSSNVPALHERAAGWDPLFAFVGGDLAYANGRDPDRWIAFLEHWSEHMRSDDRLVPLVAAIGNHEVRSGADATPDGAPFFYALFDNPFRERAYWALDVGDDLSILILDSNHTTEVAGAQTEWLEGAVSQRTERKHLFCAYHVPAYPSVKRIEGSVGNDIRRHWLPLLEAHDVDVAFEHDNHAYKRTHVLLDGESDPEGVLYLGDGAWGQGPREAASPDERPYLAVSESELHVIRAELAPDGSSRFRAINSDGDTVDRYDRSGARSGSRLDTGAGG